MSVSKAVTKIFLPLWARGISVCAARWKIFDVTSMEQFKSDVLEAQNPVIVDFQAEWCGPCKEMTPLLESVATKLEENVDLAKVDVDKLLDLGMEYNVTAVPTVVAFSNGKVVDQFVGLQSIDFISDFVKKLS